MGVAFSSSLIQERIKNAIDIGISAMKQCKETLNSVQGLKPNNCPGLIFEGLTFDTSDVISKSCFNSKVTLSEIENEVNRFLITEANKDLTGSGFNKDQSMRYLKLNEDLSNIITLDFIKYTELYFNDNGFICKNSPNINIEVVSIDNLGKFLQSNVYRSVVNTSTYTNLVNMIKSSNISHQKNIDVLTVLIILAIIFLILITLLFLGVSCGWIFVIALIVFLVLEISISFTLK